MMASQAPEQRTMEEILASIRQIISDDEAKTAKRAAAHEPPLVAAATREPREAEPPVSSLGGVNGLFGHERPRLKPVGREGLRRPDAEQSVAAAVDRAIGAVGLDNYEPLPRVVRGETVAAVGAATKAEPLLSSGAETAVGGSFDELAAAARSAGGRPLATLVEQTLRPMLKSWLDENLPPLVERLVREEIERISRGRR